MIMFIFVLWYIGGIVALVPTLIAPLVILAASLVQPNLKSYAENELKSKQSKVGVLSELLGNHETVTTVTGANFLKDRWLGAVSSQNKIGVVLI